MITESPVRDCADVGKLPLGNMAECQEAASNLGLPYRYAGSWSSNPKGCYKSSEEYVFWNNHEIGSQRSNTLAICQNSGKYLLPV